MLIAADCDGLWCVTGCAGLRCGWWYTAALNGGALGYWTERSSLELQYIGCPFAPVISWLMILHLWVEACGFKRFKTLYLRRVRKMLHPLTNSQSFSLAFLQSRQTQTPTNNKILAIMPSGTNSQGNNYNTPGGTNSSGGSSYCITIPTTMALTTTRTIMVAPTTIVAVEAPHTLHLAGSLVLPLLTNRRAFGWLYPLDCIIMWNCQCLLSAVIVCWCGRFVGRQVLW